MIYLLDQDISFGDHAIKMKKIIHDHCNAEITHIPISNTIKIAELKNICDRLISVVGITDIVVCPWCFYSTEYAIDDDFENLSKLCFVVAAAGNNKQLIDQYFFPARTKGVIAIGALNKSGQKTQFSNYSINKEMYWVPGTNYQIGNEFETGTCVSTSLFSAFLYNALQLGNFNHVFESIEKYKKSIYIDNK